jgi:hypothetical protein
MPIQWNSNEANWAFGLEDIINKLGLKPGTPIKLNVAGNGMQTLAKHGITQEQANAFTERVVKFINEKIGISEVRSGGQTGIDEAGIIAAQRLGIKSSVNAPKGWVFRDASGTDIPNEREFKSRFQQSQQ